MNILKTLVAATFCVAFCLISFAQPAKPKTPVKSKPVAPTAKVDYDKMKKDIRSLYMQEKHAEVIKKATQYLLKFPKDTAVTFQKAISHVSLKQYPVGFSMIKNLYINTDSSAKYIAYMAFSVPENDLLTSGIACADESIKLSPAAPFGYFVKGGLYSDKGEHKKALPYMTQMNSAIRDDEERKMFGQFYAKELAFNEQKDQALAAIEVLANKFPTDREILYSYASIYRLDKAYDKALEKYDIILKLYPEDVDMMMQKAITLNLAGKVNESCSLIETLVAKDESFEFMRFRYKCPAYFAAPTMTGFKTATWEVNANGNSYDFSVSNAKGSVDTDFEFDWSMTSSADANGHVKITKDAMDKAIAQNNYFGPALKNATLTDKTTVWVSKEVINSLIKNGKSKMDVGDGEEEYTVVADDVDNRDTESLNEKFSINGAQKYLNTIHVTNASGKSQLWILKDAKNPMIIKMDIGFIISLKSIE